MGCHGAASGELAGYSCEYAAAVDMSGLALSVFRISVVVEVGIYIRMRPMPMAIMAGKSGGLHRLHLVLNRIL